MISGALEAVGRAVLITYSGCAVRCLDEAAHDFPGALNGGNGPQPVAVEDPARAQRLGRWPTRRFVTADELSDGGAVGLSDARRCMASAPSDAERRDRSERYWRVRRPPDGRYPI